MSSVIRITPVAKLRIITAEQELGDVATLVVNHGGEMRIHRDNDKTVADIYFDERFPADALALLVLLTARIHDETPRNILDQVAGKITASLDWAGGVRPTTTEPADGTSDE